MTITDKSSRFPKISIVTPNYNLGAFLDKTITSVVSQCYPNLEYIVVDGGSVDNSLEVINKHRSSLAKVIIETDNGHADALNKGFSSASGEIMAWINSDDILLPGSLHLAAYIFTNFPYIHWIQGNQTLLSETGMIVRSNSPRSISRIRCLAGDYQWIQQESTFWTRTLWDASGGFINTKISLAVDFDLWLRFFRLAKLYPIEGGIGAFRLRQEQRSASQFSEYTQEVLQLINAELTVLSDAYRTYYRNILPHAAKSVSSEDRQSLPGRIKDEDLRPLCFVSKLNRYIDSNPEATRMLLANQNQNICSSTNTRSHSGDLAFLRDKYKGKRLFIMGNGPSLNKTDLSLLANEYVFACNACFLLFDRIKWHPSFYTCVDTRVLPDRALDIIEMHRKYPNISMFFPRILRTYDGSGRRTNTASLIPEGWNRYFFDDYPPDQKCMPWSAFSLDAEKGLAIPNTVTVTMLQLGCFLGFDEIYLIGCDTSYTIPKSVVQSGPQTGDGGALFLTSTQDDDPNHFDSSYFGKGRAWHNPKVEDMILHYQYCKDVLDEIGVKVYNATVGGSLEVFPRIDYNTLF